MSTYELIEITGPGEQFFELDTQDDLITLRAVDGKEDPDEAGIGDASLTLSVDEAEQLIAKLAVKVAQARMA